MSTPFSIALRTAVAGSGRSLSALSRGLAACGTPVGVSTLSSWQTGENQPEREASLAALASLEGLLGLPPRALLGLLPTRRPRGRWKPPTRTNLPHQRMWRSPSAVERVLSRLEAVPSDLYVPARVSRTMKVYIDADGCERETRHRHLLRGEGADALRMISLLRSASLPRLPVLVDTEGCRAGRVRADVPGSLSALEVLFEAPLRDGELREIGFGIRYPPGQRECHADLRVPPGMRDLVLQAVFDGERVPGRCVGFYRAARERPERVVVEGGVLEGGGGGMGGMGGVAAGFQWVVLDPVPGIYGVRWEW